MCELKGMVMVNAINFPRYRWEGGVVFWGRFLTSLRIVERPQLSQPLLVCNIRQSYLYLCQAKHPSVSHCPNPCKQWKFLTAGRSCNPLWISGTPVSRNELQDGAAVVFWESKVGWYDMFLINFRGSEWRITERVIRIEVFYEGPSKKIQNDLHLKTK